MLDLLQNVLHYIETSGNCKTCILQTTHDDIMKKKRLQAEISSAIILELKQRSGEEDEKETFSETAGSHADGTFEGEVVSIAQLSLVNHKKYDHKSAHKLTDRKLTIGKLSANKRTVRKSSGRKQTADKKKQTKVPIPKEPSYKHCKKKFSSEGTKKKHNCLRQPKRIYKCKECDSSFEVMDDLRKHRIIHQPKKEFYCNFCGKGFSTSHGLLIHCTSHRKRQYNCPNCDQVFYKKSDYHEHAREIHNISQYKPEKGTKCVVYGCTVYFTTTPKRSFHAFPNPQRDSARYRTWVDNVRKLDDRFQPPATYPKFYACMICSDHFTKDSYEPRSSVNELCNFRKRPKLKGDAIPTIFFNATNGDS